jgi:diguanylate cyclase (GGDEF)-like protein
MAISFAAIRLPAVKREASELIEAGILNLVLIGLVLALPWDRLPRTADLVPPLVYMVVVALLTDAVGGAASAYSTLLLLPVLWLAMYGTRVQLAVVVIGVGLLLAMPVLLIGHPAYTSEEWRRALLWVTAAGIIGLAVQDLVEQVRQRADALHTVSAAVGRRTREIETRSAICEAAKDNAGAQYALLLEPDTNARRLVATAATDASVENTEFYLAEAHAPAVRSYVGGRELFHQGVDESPLVANDGTFTEVASIFWFPIPGRECAMGVLGVAWVEHVKRLPETLPAVMEALAAEAAGVIERTTLLLKLEGVERVDELTGLPNERAWEEEVARELSRARRQGTALSVILLDLGEFERTPDGYVERRDGALLRAAADAWRRELGPTDFLAHRAPAGRFAVLLPNVAAAGAQTASLRLQALAPAGQDCSVSVATWDGVELPATLVARAETEIELEKAASRAD